MCEGWGGLVRGEVGPGGGVGVSHGDGWLRDGAGRPTVSCRLLAGQGLPVGTQAAWLGPVLGRQPRGGAGVLPPQEGRVPFVAVPECQEGGGEEVAPGAARDLLARVWGQNLLCPALLQTQTPVAAWPDARVRSLPGSPRSALWAWPPRPAASATGVSAGPWHPARGAGLSLRAHRVPLPVGRGVVRPSVRTPVTC